MGLRRCWRQKHRATNNTKNIGLKDYWVTIVWIHLDHASNAVPQTTESCSGLNQTRQLYYSSTHVLHSLKPFGCPRWLKWVQFAYTHPTMPCIHQVVVTSEATMELDLSVVAAVYVAHKSKNGKAVCVRDELHNSFHPVERSDIASHSHHTRVGLHDCSVTEAGDKILVCLM